MGVLNYNGALYLATGIDNSGLRRDASEAEGIIEHLGRTAKSVGAMMGVAFTLDAAKDFAVKVATVRGEFQKLEAAFKSMLGNKEAADRLMQQLTRTAATTPFGMQEVAGGAKQLLAYGVAANEVNDTLVRLGNIASGLSIPLNDLVYLYGTTMTQGRLFTQDLRQFMGRGIPIADELAKQFGVTKDQVQGLVEAGKVGFPEVQKALESLTNEGGKFYNLMEEQSKTIAGKISNLSDAIEMMFNDIGKSSEGVIAKALDGVTSLVENYTQVGEKIGEIVVVYGTYKAALIAVMAIQKQYAAYEAAITARTIALQKEAVQQGKALAMAEAGQLAKTQLLAEAKGNLARKLGQVAESLIPNLYAAAAVAIGVMATALYKAATEAGGLELAQKRVNDAMERAATSVSDQRAKIDSLVAVIRNENTSYEEKESVLKELIAINPQYLSGLNQANILTAQGTTILNGYIEALARKKQLEALSDELAASYDRKDKAEQGKAAPWYWNFLNWTASYGNAITSLGVSMLLKGKTAGKEYEQLTRNVNDNIVADETITQAEIGLSRDRILAKTRKNKKEEVDANKKGNAAIAVNTFETVDQVSAKIRQVSASLAINRKTAQMGFLDPAVIKTQEKMLDELNEKYKTLTGKPYDQPKGTGRVGGHSNQVNDLLQEQKEVAEVMAEIEELTRNARKRIEDADLEMMNEGLEKKLQKIDLDYQRELQEIEEWKKKLEKANKTLTGKEALTEDQQAYYEASKAAMDQKNMKARANATNEWKRKEAEAYDEMLQAFGNYKEKEAAIAREYARKIEDAEKEGRTNEAERLRREAIQKQAAAAESELGKDDHLKTFFKHTEKQTLQTAKKVRVEIANTIKYLKTKGAEGTVDAEKAKLLQRMLGDPELVRQTLEGLETDLEKVDDTIEGIQHQKVFDALIANFKKLRKSVNGSTEQMSALNSVISGLSSVGGIISQLGNAMSDCDIKAGKVVSTIGNAITNAASFAAAGASVGGPWGAVAGAVVGAASAIIPAIGKVEEWTDAMEKSYQSQLKWLDQAKAASMEIVKGYGSIEEKLKAATEAANIAAEELEVIKEKTRERNSKKANDGDGHSTGYYNADRALGFVQQRGGFDNYNRFWENTPEANGYKSAEKRYRWDKHVVQGKKRGSQGAGYFEMEWDRGYRPQSVKGFDVEALEKNGIDVKRLLTDTANYAQELTLEQLTMLTRTHSAFLKVLDSSTQDAISARKKMLEDEKKMQDETLAGFTGVSFDGLLSEYESFLKKAGDGSKDLGKTIEGHLRDAIVKGLIDKKTEARIKKAYERIANLMQNREKMSAEEYQKQLQEAKDELTQIYKELAEKKKEAFDKTGLKDYEETKENSMRGALAKASQESIDLLAGVMGAIRVSIEQIIRLLNESRGKGGGVAEYYDSIRQSFAALREIQIAGWKEVTAIKDMVQQIHVTQVTVAQLSQTVADHTASIKETSRRMAESITAINNSGVKIKGGGLGL